MLRATNRRLSDTEIHTWLMRAREGYLFLDLSRNNDSLIAEFGCCIMHEPIDER